MHLIGIDLTLDQMLPVLSEFASFATCARHLRSFCEVVVASGKGGCDFDDLSI